MPRIPKIIPRVSGGSVIARILKVSAAIRKLPAIPLLAKIPLRTKLIFVGCLVVVAVAVPVMLSLVSSGGNAGGQEVAPMQEASAESDELTSGAIEEEVSEVVAESVESEGSLAGDPVIKDGAQLVQSEDLTLDLPTETRVGGAISEDTTWTAEGNPYIVTGVVRIKPGMTLTIEPGVTVTRDSEGDMFLVRGMLKAHGTADNPIVFDGGGNSDFFGAPDFANGTSLDLDYCRIENGLSLRPLTQFGAFSLKHSRITNLSAPSYIWFPEGDAYIEKNSFLSAAGFSILTAQDTQVYITNNNFKGKYPGISDYADYWIQNRGSFNQSQTIVKYNSFSLNDGVALKLLGGYDTSAIIAVDNYWGTQDKNLINGMVYDKDDDDSCAGYIDYVPLLVEPHSKTP